MSVYAIFAALMVRSIQICFDVFEALRFVYPPTMTVWLHTMPDR